RNEGRSPGGRGSGPRSGKEVLPPQLTLAQQHRTLDGVAELPYIARPGMGEENALDLRRKVRPGELVLLGQTIEKAGGEQQDVVAPLAQRGQVDRQDAETIVE